MWQAMLTPNLILLLSHCPNRGNHSHKLEQSVALAPHGNASPAETQVGAWPGVPKEGDLAWLVAVSGGHPGEPCWGWPHAQSATMSRKRV